MPEIIQIHAAFASSNPIKFHADGGCRIVLDVPDCDREAMKQLLDWLQEPAILTFQKEDSNHP